MQNKTTDNQFDLIIIGGGLAGASLACALKTSNLKIAVVEAYQLNTDSQPSYDDRTVAISFGSSRIFDSIGIWSSLSTCAEPIKTIHISDRGHFGVTRLHAEQEGVDALGYVLENRDFGQKLYATMLGNNGDGSTSEITLFCPAQLTALQQDKDKVSVQISVGEKSLSINAKCLVAADGNNSQVLKLLAMGSSRKDYDQVALITNVTPGNKHQGVAYERFTETGPLAFLPMQKNRCSVVWTLDPQQADYLLALDDDDFLQQLQQRFGYRLGELKKTGVRQLYPLSLQSATQMHQGRIAVIGNAAHSVHPVAGQGFNLALRDVAILAELLVDSERANEDIGAPQVLHRYAECREDDIKKVYRFTDALVKTFSNSIAPVAHMRSLGLLTVDILPDIKHMLAAQSMGLGGHQSRLNRGLPL